jgi:hypothetical protein
MMVPFSNKIKIPRPELADRVVEILARGQQQTVADHSGGTGGTGRIG